MKSLLKWLVIVAVVIGLFIFVSDRMEKRRVARAAQEHAQREAERQAEETRQAAIYAHPGDPNAPTISHNPQAEHEFRQLAAQCHVEVLEYRGIAPREVLVGLRSRERMGIPDLLDAATRRDIIFDFDDDFMRDHQETTIDPMNGAQITTTRVILRMERR